MTRLAGRVAIITGAAGGIGAEFARGLDASEAFGVDPGTWGNWERGKTILYCKHRVLVAQFLDLSVDTLNKEMTALWNRLHERIL